MAGPDRSDRPGGGLTEEAPGPSHVSIFSIGFRATNQRIAPAILDLVDSGTVRVIDALFVSKNSEYRRSVPVRGPRTGSLWDDTGHVRRSARGGILATTVPISRSMPWVGTWHVNPFWHG